VDGGYRLAGRPLRSGDVIEVYTNAANGWIRARFEDHDGPRVAIHLWDPIGRRDEDGLPPWVGELDAPLPARAVARWPD
jgi:hypothetical protein